MKSLKFSTILIEILSLVFLTGCGAEIDPRTIWSNNKGAKELHAGAASDAQKHFLDALGIDPFISEIHTNLGLTYHTLKQGDVALQSYESAERWAQNNKALYISRFNQGVLQGENKKIEQALEAYQRALLAKPDFIEAKTNIELLVQNQKQNDSGENKEQNQQDGQGQDQKDQKKQDQEQNKDQKQNQDQKDQKGNDKKDQDQPQQNQDKQYKKSEQYKPRQFEGELSESDVKKILGELKQQEQKIRGNFYRNEMKERPRDKDW